jgi:hypothetical protein
MAVTNVRTIALACGLLAWTAGFSAPGLAAELQTVGWIERARLGAEGVLVSAKLDTGADSSSLHATGVRWMTRDDGDWVAFDVIGADGTKAHFERKVVRVVRVKRVGASPQKRPTILMGVCVGKVFRLTEVNLTDRTGFNQEFLVGRRFLENHFLVDSSRTNTVEPACAEARGP